MSIVVHQDDLASVEVQALVAEHLSGMHEHSPAGHVNALAIERLRAPGITFWTASVDGALAGCGALKELDRLTGEVKSMRTRQAYLRRGVGQAILDEIVRTARGRGYARLLLETGTGPAFGPAHALYLRNGFEWSGPFGEYTATDFNVFMAMTLGAPARFVRYQLRTTDAAAAGLFYDAVLGHRGDGIEPLPEIARARGARPHWLGHVNVQHVGGPDVVAAAFLARGAVRLGPPLGAGDTVVLRDTGEAVVAVTSAAAPSTAGVVWHQLNASSAARAAADYAALLGWSLTDELDLGPLGRHQMFSFGVDEPASGSMSDIHGREGVHPHWLFFFSVPSLPSALDRVRDHGGVVVGPIRLPSGAQVAVCDDAQGAAFGVVAEEDAGRLATGRSA